MSQVRERLPAKHLDWDALYRQGTPPWDAGVPSVELVRLVEEKALRQREPWSWVAAAGPTPSISPSRGFEMTAVDSSPTALERARVRAEREDALLRLVFADAFEFGQTAGQFDLVFDVGLYHYIRHTDLERFLDLLWRVTRPGSYYLTVAARKATAARAARRRSPGSRFMASWAGCSRNGRVADLPAWSPQLKGGYPAWSCLMRRPVVGKFAVP